MDLIVEIILVMEMKHAQLVQKIVELVLLIESVDDGIINQANETCDNGTLNGQACTPLYGSSCTYCSTSCKNVTLTGPYCGDGTCNGNENCSTCSQDCGTCSKQENCTVCKDSKPLDDSGYSIEYLNSLNKKTTVIPEDENVTVMNLSIGKGNNSSLKNNPTLLFLILIIGVMILLLLILIVRLIKR